MLEFEVHDVACRDVQQWHFGKRRPAQARLEGKIPPAKLASFMGAGHRRSPYPSPLRKTAIRMPPDGGPPTVADGGPLADILLVDLDP
jgi:hypothetical protein